MWDELRPIVGLGMQLGVLGIIVLVALGIGLSFVAHWDPFPASGEAYGYIYYTATGGIFQQTWVCWKDTPYAKSCEIFNPDGKIYSPGRYRMKYSCERFVWVWEAPNECKIIEAEQLGDLDAVETG